jgi:hypothetical protein
MTLSAGEVFLIFDRAAEELSAQWEQYEIFPQLSAPYQSDSSDLFSLKYSLSS